MTNKVDVLTGSNNHIIMQDKNHMKLKYIFSKVLILRIKQSIEHKNLGKMIQYVYLWLHS